MKAQEPQYISDHLDHHNFQKELEFSTSTLEHPDWKPLILDMGKVSLWGVGTAIGLSLVFYVIFNWLSKRKKQNTNTSKKRRGIRWIKPAGFVICFLAIWLYAFIVYDIGMCTGDRISLITNAPMAMLYAFKVFLLESDVSEIHHEFHSSWVYSFNFALAHFFAAIYSTLLLIRIFGFQLVSWIKMSWASLWRPEVKDIYIFWQMNEPSELLMKNIKNNEDEKDKKKYRIVVVRTAETPKEHSGSHGKLDHVFNFVSMPSEEIDTFNEVECLVVTTRIHPSSIKLSPEEKSVDILREELRMTNLRRLLKEPSWRTKFKKKRKGEKVKPIDRRLHLFFLGDDEEANLHAVSLLLHDETILDFAKKKEGKKDDGRGEQEVHIYCHARKNSIHRVIEDRHLEGKNIHARVVDSSTLNVDLLKQRKEVLPVNFVDVESDATVSSPFNALIIGFSEVGQDCTRFLYEYGAFVRTGSNKDDAVRSPFSLTVIDNRMADVSGAFLANIPALVPDMQSGTMGPGGSLLTISNLDCRSFTFWQELNTSKIADLNYVVVATEDDELNMTVAVRILKSAIRYRKDLRNFCILVRIHRDVDNRFQDIIDHYNGLVRGDEEIITEECAEGPLHIFGLDNKVYTRDLIINDELEKEAQTFHDKYEATNDEYDAKADAIKKSKDKESASPAAPAEKSIELEKPTDKPAEIPSEPVESEPAEIPSEPAADKKSPKTYTELVSEKRKHNQNVANSLHKLSKSLLAEKALRKAGIEEYQWDTHSRHPESYVAYTFPEGTAKELQDKIVAILDVLAQTEHLRWNAAHEISGYVYGVKKNEARMEHNNLKAWRLLDEHTRGYDYNVIDVTFQLSEEQKKKN